MNSYDIEMGAATFHPQTVLSVLENRACRVAFMQPCRRPQDARGGENPNRLYKHHQYQVIMMPPPTNIQSMVINSLYECGVDPRKHSIDFVENNWQSPSMGAAGKGYEILCNGTEVLPFTYFQQLAGKELDIIPIELAYGTERLALVSQGKDHIFDLIWDRVGNNTITYGDVHGVYEKQLCNIQYPANALKAIFNAYEDICMSLGALPDLLPAYESFLKLSHTFNLIEASGGLSINERVDLLGRTRKCANECLAKFIGGKNDEPNK